MRDEIARSMKKLQLENLDKPFFVAYRVMEALRCNISASFGALIYDGDCETAGSPRNRGVTVEVRVGDYTRDNTNFWAPMNVGGVVQLTPMGVTMPIDDNYDEIRRQLWLGHR